MDQIDAILKLKNCFKGLEEIDPEQVFSNINFAKTKIATTILELVQSLDVSKLETESPEFKFDICEVCEKPIFGVMVGTGTGLAHRDCFDKPKLKKIKPHKIHSHPLWETRFSLVHDHVIIDREIYNQLLEKWDQIEEYLTKVAVVI